MAQCVIDRTLQAAIIDDDGSGTTGTPINKAWVGSFLTDHEKGWFNIQGDTYPVAQFIDRGLLLQYGDSSNNSGCRIEYLHGGVGGPTVRMMDKTGAFHMYLTVGPVQSWGGLNSIRTATSAGSSPEQVMSYEVQASGGTPAVGFGARVVTQMYAEDLDHLLSGAQDIVWSDITDGAEISDRVWSLTDDGGSSFTERLRLQGTGSLLMGYGGTDVSGPGYGIFNTDDGTDWELGLLYWDADKFVISTSAGGAGSVHPVQLGSASVPALIPYTKTDTGDPIGAEGMHCINTFNNNYKVYADGAWRTLATW